MRAGFYPTSEQALKHIILDYIDRRIAWAQAKRFACAHSESKSDWTASFAKIIEHSILITGRATSAVSKTLRMVTVETKGLEFGSGVDYR